MGWFVHTQWFSPTLGCVRLSDSEWVGLFTGWFNTTLGCVGLTDSEWIGLFTHSGLVLLSFVYGSRTVSVGWFVHTQWFNPTLGCVR